MFSEKLGHIGKSYVWVGAWSALSWPHELQMTNLKPAQQLRSVRLLAILTQAFVEYPRAQTYSEGNSSGAGVGAALQSKLDTHPWLGHTCIFFFGRRPVALSADRT